MKKLGWAATWLVLLVVALSRCGLEQARAEYCSYRPSAVGCPSAGGNDGGTGGGQGMGGGMGTGGGQTGNGGGGAIGTGGGGGNGTGGGSDSRDSGVVDGGSTTSDAGVADGGSDAGMPMDSGMSDAGPTDAGPMDAGLMDAGSCAPIGGAGGPLSVNRYNHAAARLHCGRVLIVGGADPANNQALDSAELYDPATNRFYPTLPLPERRAGLSAFTLSNGRVLVAGGTEAIGDLKSTTFIYQNGAWAPGPNLGAPRSSAAKFAQVGTSVVMMGGGNGALGAFSERYDESNNNWTVLDPAAFFTVSDFAHAFSAPSLFIFGGRQGSGTVTASNDVRSINLMDGGSVWTPPATELPQPRMGGVAVTMANGKILLVGSDVTSVQSHLIYDPLTHSVALLSPLPGAYQPFVGHTVTALQGEQAIIIGGGMSQSDRSNSAVIVDITGTGSTVVQSMMNVARSGHTTTRLLDGSLLVVGGGSATDTILAEKSMPGFLTWVPVQ